ncbi:DNA-binding transcriptional MerR regulator [Arthrobacter sp. AG258]|uniref:MerR family transcriptional regulator n=1 Tax=Arthrobacter sp. AG258 TaxID=2183899 RepID=UPI0010D4D0FC|nr:MerR family transcriptional regulator [Arthrobacter sp. AG258]TDT74435.1 DNA-binding transcriptional MerR regulator [Arthrobacter sp. AG258]
MTDISKLMPIGHFSSLSRISVRMLRHYDANGVLAPAVVDRATGYRWYAHDQLREASEIRRLRDVGFGVSAIGALLAARGTPAYAQALSAQRAALAEESSAALRRLVIIERMLDQQRQEDAMSTISAELTTLPEQTLITLRGRVPDYTAEGELWARFTPEISAQGIRVTGAGGCIEHDGEYREHDVDESVFLEVAPDTEAAEPLSVLHFPARRVVAATVTGPYTDAIPRAHEAIAAFMAENDWRPAREDDDLATHHFNIYRNDPSQTPEAELVTSVFMPVVEA